MDHGEERAPAGGWRVDGVLVGCFVAITVALANGLLIGVDLDLVAWVDAHRPPWAHAVARRLNHLGSANLLAAISLAMAAIVGLRRRTWRPVLPVVLAFGISYVVVGPMKFVFDRAAPHSFNFDSAWLFADVEGWSYPSGHVVNAVIWYQVLVLLLGALLTSFTGRELPAWARLLLRWAPPMIVTGTVTYLGFHWLTDSLAALPLGVFLDRLLTRARARLNC